MEKLNRRYVFATLNILCSVTRLNSSEAHLKIFKSIPNKSTIQKKKKEIGTIIYLSTTPYPSYQFLFKFSIMPAEDIQMEDASNNSEQEQIQEQEYDINKIKILPGSSEDGTSASFQIIDEDHTLGNALRYIIMKNPEVEFCGYSIPHPSENKLNIRIQTYGNISAVEALHQGLDNLSELCGAIEDKFDDAIKAGGYSTKEP